MCVWQKHIESANRKKELPFNGVVIFLRGPEIPFARLTICLLETLRMVYHRNPPWGLLRVHHSLHLSRSHSYAHIKCVRPHIADISFRSVFKLPRVLVKHCKDLFLLFFLISCAYEVSGCPRSPICLSSPLHSSASLPAPLCQQAQTSGYTQSPMGAPSAVHRQIRKGHHSVLLLHACLLSLHLPPAAHFLPAVTHFSQMQPGISACHFECYINVTWV